MVVNTIPPFGNKYVKQRYHISTLYGYLLPFEVENAIYRQDWPVVRSWAVTTALTHNDAEFVKNIEAMIPKAMTALAIEPVRVDQTVGW